MDLRFLGINEDFLKSLRRLRDLSITYGAYPIDEEDGILLYVITYILNIMKGCIDVVEIGTGCGYSTTWIAKALNDSKGCGYVITFEVDDRRANIALSNLKDLGLSKYVGVRIENALKGLEYLDIIPDMAFFDADIENYVKYIEILKNKIDEFFVLTAHNAFWLVNESFTEYLTLQGFKFTILPTPQGFLLAYLRVS